ncbi:TetR/AcrR family transcriptional regulator [Kribbella sp. DT2]|uniref:TetR/AcrR family transcriptional regulator n=1 Tax=Kribbella sp. DT2 TaxID=3393427 RepID=UPI003CFAE4B9
MEVILEAAAQLFQRHGYASATTNKIAERAGVSVGSLYQYFPNKDALLLALAEQHLDAAARIFAATFAEFTDEDLPAVLRVLVARVAELHTDRPELHRLLFDQAPRTPELVAAFRRTEREIADRLADQLRRLGVGGSSPELTALLVVQGIEAQIHGAMLDPPSGRTPAEVVVAVEHLWTEALG